MTRDDGIRYLLEKVPEGEPVFILRGRDTLASGAVYGWAVRAEANGVDNKKVRGARDCAELMHLYAVESKLGRLPD